MKYVKNLKISISKLLTIPTSLAISDISHIFHNSTTFLELFATFLYFSQCFLQEDYIRPCFIARRTTESKKWHGIIPAIHCRNCHAQFCNFLEFCIFSKFFFSRFAAASFQIHTATSDSCRNFLNS